MMHPLQIATSVHLAELKHNVVVALRDGSSDCGILGYRVGFYIHT